MARGGSDIAHGTYAGYQAHLRRNLPPCRPCRDGKNDYVRRLRVARNEQTQAEHAASVWALRKLQERHRVEFHRLFDLRLTHELAVVRSQRTNAKTPASGIDDPGAGVIT